MTRIEALRQIVATKKAAKLDGHVVDTFTAAKLLTSYKALDGAGRRRFASMTVDKMVTAGPSGLQDSKLTDVINDACITISEYLQGDDTGEELRLYEEFEHAVYHAAMKYKEKLNKIIPYAAGKRKKSATTTIEVGDEVTTLVRMLQIPKGAKCRVDEVRTRSSGTIAIAISWLDKPSVRLWCTVTDVTKD